jgi:3-(3-hydroxy-phenyl)propionate hydroxylase
VLAGAPEGLLDTYEEERRPHVEAMRRLAVALGSFVQTADCRVARVRDVFLRALDKTAIASWARARIKPLPAYGAGAFAERPHRIVFKRGVGTQFPQPVVRVGGDELLLDEVAGRGWCALSADANAAEALAAGGLHVLLLGHDLDDSEGTIGKWLTCFGASWVLLRPDRFVFAHGSGAADIRRALDALHRNLGRATSELIGGRSGRVSQGLVAA